MSEIQKLGEDLETKESIVVSIKNEVPWQYRHRSEENKCQILLSH